MRIHQNSQKSDKETSQNIYQEGTVGELARSGPLMCIAVQEVSEYRTCESADADEQENFQGMCFPVKSGVSVQVHFSGSFISGYPQVACGELFEGPFQERFFIEVDSQPRDFTQSNVAIFDLDGIDGDFVADRFEIYEVFRDQEIGHARRGLNRCRQANGRAVVVMWRDRHVIGLGHCSDFS